MNFETCKWKTIDSSQTVMLIPAWIKLRKFVLILSTCILLVTAQTTAKSEVQCIEVISIHVNHNIVVDMTYLLLFSGCGKLWVTDGIWKLTFPHCMFKVKVN